MTEREKNNLDIRKAVLPQVKIEKQNYFLILGMLEKGNIQEIKEHLFYFIEDCRQREDD